MRQGAKNCQRNRLKDEVTLWPCPGRFVAFGTLMSVFLCSWDYILRCCYRCPGDSFRPPLTKLDVPRAAIHFTILFNSFFIIILFARDMIRISISSNKHKRSNRTTPCLSTDTRKVNTYRL
ncbi:hypothetical protein GGI42DRAFT_283464 [Trichoderma sp. SZMC 28013]